MSLHKPCSHARQCPWGSESVPGTCGFTSCKRDEHFRDASHGDMVSARILMERGKMPYSDYVPHIINNAKKYR